MIDNNQEIKGLTHSQVQERIDNNQVNKDTLQISKSYASILKDNVFTLFNLINLILAGLIIFVGSYKNLHF